MTKLSADDRKILQDSSRFHEVHSICDLPPAIVALCSDKLAEPGQNWNATDAIVDPTLPAKRLIWAAIGGDYYVVHYERGGIAHMFHVLVAKLTKGEPKPKIVWSAIGGPFKKLHGISRRTANRQTGRSHRLRALRQTSSRFASLPHRILQCYIRPWHQLPQTAGKLRALLFRANLHLARCSIGNQHSLFCSR